MSQKVKTRKYFYCDVKCALYGGVIRDFLVDSDSVTNKLLWRMLLTVYDRLLITTLSNRLFFISCDKIP